MLYARGPSFTDPPRRPMNHLRTALVSSLLLCAVGSAQALDFHADLYLGSFQGSSDTEPVDQRTEFGGMVDLTLDVLPFGFCANVFYNEDDVSNASSGLSDVSALEVQLGIYKQFDVPVVQPFIGGGVAWLNTTLETVGQGESDEATIGAWAYVGARMTLLFIDVGVALGYTYAEVEVDGEDVDIGGWRAGVFAGIGF
jgi:Outer membrane protein beta-barrel domain